MISETINPNYLSCKFKTFGNTKMWETRGLGKVKSSTKKKQKKQTGKKRTLSSRSDEIKQRNLELLYKHIPLQKGFQMISHSQKQVNVPSLHEETQF